MAASKVFTGARALVEAAGKPIGIFTEVSWTVVYDEQVINILGNYGPVEIVYTARQPVAIQASGWRVLDHGPYADVGLPKLNQVMLFDDISFSISDRATKKFLLKAKGVKPTTVQQQVAIRQATTLNANYMAISDSDETAEYNVDSADAAVLP